MRKRVISTLLAMATTAGLFAGNVSAVYADCLLYTSPSPRDA